MSVLVVSFVKIDFFYSPIAKFCLAVSSKRNNFATENN